MKKIRGKLFLLKKFDLSILMLITLFKLFNQFDYLKRFIKYYNNIYLINVH